MSERNDILSLMDQFIDKIQQLRRIMLGVSLSALILAPFAIGISVYLVMHHKFMLIIERENEFGLMLLILLSSIFIISSIWLYTGIKQFGSLNSWNSRYNNYLEKKKKLEKSISEKLSLNE